MCIPDIVPASSIFTGLPSASFFIIGHSLTSSVLTAVPFASLFIIGHEAASIFMTLPSASFAIIGHEAPSPLQQSQSSQQESASLPEASLFFSGQESPLQQQHDAAVAELPFELPYENATTASPNTS